MAEAKGELAKYELGEERIRALVTTHRLKLKQKVEETLANGWKERSAQAVELQVLRVDDENWKKEGHSFYKMDENILMVHEDLAEDFEALASTHTTTIGNLIEEFND